MKSLGGPASPTFDEVASQNLTLVLAEDGRRPALESATLRHGVLTRHLADALTGAADEDGDGLTQLPELVAHAAARMLESAYSQGVAVLGGGSVGLAFPAPAAGSRSGPGRGRRPRGPSELVLRVDQTSADSRVTVLARALRKKLGSEPGVLLARGNQPPDGLVLVGAAGATPESVDFIVRYVDPNAGADRVALRFSGATEDTTPIAAAAIAARLAAPLAMAAARKAVATLDNPHSPIRLRLDAPGRLAVGDTLALTLTPSVDCT